MGLLDIILLTFHAHWFLPAEEYISICMEKVGYFNLIYNHTTIYTFHEDVLHKGALSPFLCYSVIMSPLV